jgi:putative Mn2+ efflux pump MntP
MVYKTHFNPKAFAFAEKYGIRITTYPETFGKLKVGLLIGSMSMLSVLFGLYSVKFVNIPLFLTFRRCCILATIIVQYVVAS